MSGGWLVDTHDARGEVPARSVDAMTEHATQSADDLRLDTGRAGRTGEPEVVYAAGKTPEQCRDAIAGLLARTDGAVIATRVDADQVAAMREAGIEVEHDGVGRVAVARTDATSTPPGRIAVVTAGTSDLPVARECTATLAAFQAVAALYVDAGVAGIHRVVDLREQLAEAEVVVVVAGMEGALPSVVAGLVSAPVIAVPTSVGHGAAFEGVAALLGMLTSCAPGISVVNIDGGFSAAMVALRILRTGRGRS